MKKEGRKWSKERDDGDEANITSSAVFIKAIKFSTDYVIDNMALTILEQ